MNLTLVGIAVFFIIMVCAGSWKKTVFFVLYWVVIVGALRKWFLVGIADILLLSSNVFLTGAYLRFFSTQLSITTSKDKEIVMLMMIVVIWGVVSLFNPRLPDIRIGILGLVIHFHFMPVAFMVRKLFRSMDDLNKFFSMYIIFSVPVIIFGFIQYFSPVDSVLNQYIRATEFTVAKVGGRARITSTFSYISGYTTYLQVLILLLIFMLSAKRVKTWFRMLVYILIPATLVSMFMTGSRGPLWWSLLSIGCYLIMAARLGSGFMLKFFLRLLLIAGLVAFAVNQTKQGREAYENFMKRSEAANEDVSERLEDTFTPFKYAKYAGLLGYGIGTTYQGASRFNPDWGDMPRLFEEEPERIVLELGIVGFFLVYGLRLLLINYSWRMYKKLKVSDLKLLAICSILFQFTFLTTQSLVFNLTSGLYYWFFIGLSLLITEMDKKEKLFGAGSNTNISPRPSTLA